MLTTDHISGLFDRIRRHATAPEIELLVAGGRSALTRFANNTIHQNVAEECSVFSVRVSLDGRTARATTNKSDDDSLRDVVKRAEELARVQQPDPEMLPLATKDEAEAGGPAEAPSRYFERTAAITPEERAAAVGQMVAIAQRHKLTAAGTYSSGESFEAIVNSNGVFAWYPQTAAEISVTMMGEDSSGWQKANAPDAAGLDAQALAEVAAQKAVDSAHPRELPPGRYTVILEPAAVLDLVGFLFWDFGGLALLEQRSFLNERLGQRVFGENITITDDAYHPLQAGAPFDGEGVRRQRVQLVEGGVARSLVYARATAQKMKASELAAQAGDIRPTGHGFPLPNEVGEAPSNVVFAGPAEGEARTVEQMIADTERGILVTRTWYIREVDPYEKILTGMTRDGTFLVEQGRVKGGLRNFRFNQSLLEMLSRVESMSAPVRASGEEGFDMVVPAMKVRDFNFTEVTRF
jgi:predicted Zn-dependent protease